MNDRIVLSSVAGGILLASCALVARAEGVRCAASPITLKPVDLVRELRERADRRISQIRAVPNMQIPAAAPRRYLSSATGDDASDGLTPETAWRTVERLNRETLAPGTFVLFERGGVYRGSVKATTGVTLTAYGSGEKPHLFASPKNGADPKRWERTENPGIWAYDVGHDDVGTLVFDDGKSCAEKILLKTDPKTGKKSDLKTWRPFVTYRDIAGDLRFWHDYYPKGTGKVYLCSERNPGERFKTIEFNVCKHGVAVAGDGVTVDNLSIAYVGAHGVGAGTCRNLTVKNCEFAWIGGSIMSEAFMNRPFPTRFGNAVEIFGGCDGYVVSNCYIRQVFDAGITHQFGIHEGLGLKRFDQRNIVYTRNVLENCNYSIEYFLTVPNGNQSLMENVRITDNLMFDAGLGFCEQRPDPWVATHIMAYSAPNKNRARDFLIKGNVMCGARRTLVEIASTLPAPDGGTSLPRMEDNLLVGKSGGLFGYVTDAKAKNLRFDEDCQTVLDARGRGNKVVVIP